MLVIAGHAAAAAVLVLDIVWDNVVFTCPNLDLKSGRCRHPHRDGNNTGTYFNSSLAVDAL